MSEVETTKAELGSRMSTLLSKPVNPFGLAYLLKIAANSGIARPLANNPATEVAQYLIDLKESFPDICLKSPTAIISYTSALKSSFFQQVVEKSEPSALRNLFLSVMLRSGDVARFQCQILSMISEVFRALGTNSSPSVRFPVDDKLFKAFQAKLSLQECLSIGLELLSYVFKYSKTALPRFWTLYAVETLECISKSKDSFDSGIKSRVVNIITELDYRSVEFSERLWRGLDSIGNVEAAIEKVKPTKWLRTDSSRVCLVLATAGNWEGVYKIWRTFGLIKTEVTTILIREVLNGNHGIVCKIIREGVAGAIGEWIVRVVEGKGCLECESMVRVWRSKRYRGGNLERLVMDSTETYEEQQERKRRKLEPDVPVAVVPEVEQEPFTAPQAPISIPNVSMPVKVPEPIEVISFPEVEILEPTPAITEESTSHVETKPLEVEPTPQEPVSTPVPTETKVAPTVDVADIDLTVDGSSDEEDTGPLWVL